MKITLILISALTSFSQAALINIDATTGTIAGTTTTWTVDTTSAASAAIGANGFTSNASAAAGATETVTITFSAPVDLGILPHSTTGAANFSNTNGNNTFTADAGTWSFTPGATVLTRADGNPGNWFNIAGSSLVTDQVTGGNHATGAAIASEDWGSFLISGVTTFTWVNDSANTEGFNFAVMESAIPEPTSVALLGLGGLALLSRRTRK